MIERVVKTNGLLCCFSGDRTQTVHAIRTITSAPNAFRDIMHTHCGQTKGRSEIGLFPATDLETRQHLMRRLCDGCRPCITTMILTGEMQFERIDDV